LAAAEASGSLPRAKKVALEGRIAVRFAAVFPSYLKVSREAHRESFEWPQDDENVVVFPWDEEPLEWVTSAAFTEE